MTKAEVILKAAQDPKTTDEELAILDAAQESEFTDEEVGKIKGDADQGVDAASTNTAPKNTSTESISEDTSLEFGWDETVVKPPLYETNLFYRKTTSKPKKDKLPIGDMESADEEYAATETNNTWVDSNGESVNFTYPEVEVARKRGYKTRESANYQELEKTIKTTLLQKIGNINIFKGKTLKSFFSKRNHKDFVEKQEVEQENLVQDIELPTSETDQTQTEQTIIPEFETKLIKSYYYDEEKGEVKEDIPTTIDDLLVEDKPFTFTFDGEKIYLDEPVKEEKEEELEVATTILGDVVRGVAKIYNLGKSVYDDKDERDELLDNIEKRYNDINNNLAIGMQSIYVDGLKLLETSVGGKAGMTALDDMFGDYGDAVWFTPEGGVVDLADKTLTTEEKYDQGYTLIYKDSGVKVGDPYKEYVVSQFENILEYEILKNSPNLSISGGYKDGDAAMFFGGVFNAVTSLAETMGPALTTKGMSLIPQITAPFYIDAAREKAKRLYPNLSEKDAIEKLVMSGEEDVLLPNLLGLAAGQLEKIGFKGIIKAMRMNPATFSQGVTNIILSGQREGITEWGQTGLEVLNKSMAAGKDKATYLAWAAMIGPQGLEAYLQGVVGGTGISTAGNLINRALRTNREDVRKINNNIRQSADLKGKLSFFNNNKSKSNEKLRDHYMSEITRLNTELLDIVNNSNKLSRYLTKEEQEFTVSLLERYDAKNLEYNGNYYDTYKGVFEFADSNGISVEQALKENYPQLDAQWQELREILEKEAVDIVSQIDAIRKRANERMIDDGIKKADKRGIMRTVFETKDEVNNWLNDPANKELFEKQAKQDGVTVTELKNKYKTSNGWELDGEVFINKMVAIETGAVSVTEHEVAHILFGKSIRDKNGNITEEGQELIVKFKKAIGPKVETIIRLKLLANGYNLKDLNIEEEYLTFYLDGVADGSFKTNKKALRLLGKEVTSLLKDSGYTNIKFKTAQDIMDWFKSYIDDKDGGKSEVERTPPSTSIPLSSFSTTDLEGPVIELGEVSQDVWSKTGADNAITYMFGKLDGLIKSKITLAMQDLPDFSEEDFIQRTYMELIPHIRNFVPAQYNEDGSRKLDGNGNLIGNDNLWAWITNQLQNKSLEALKSDDVTKPQFEESVQDEGSFINDIEADEYVDLELSIEEDVTYTALRRILGVERGDKLHKKIIEGIKKIIPLEIKNLDTPAFKKALRKYFNDYLFDDIKQLLGGASTKEGYKNFITNNAEALYNLFPQSVFNKSFQPFIVKGDRLSVPETKEAQRKGLLPKTLTKKQMADGIYLYTKLPWNDDTEQKWIDNFLNPPKGRPASKQNSLIELISYTLGVDATMEIINSDEFKGKYDIPGVVIATIGVKIDRGANVRFNKTNGSEGNLNENNFDENELRKMVKYIETEVGFDEIGPGDVADLLKTNFPTAAEDVIALIEKMADLGYIKDQNGTMFLQGIMLSEDIDKKDKDQVKEDTLEDKQDKLNKAANILAPRLGPEVMNLLGFDIFGYINRMMDAAKRKKNPEYEYDKTQPQYREDDAGNEISGPFYQALEALKLKVKNSEVKLPEGLNLDDVRLMNKKYPLFQKIEKILNDGDSKIDGSNIAWKKAEILKLKSEITAAGEANIKLAKFIASEIIKADKIDVVTAIHLLQIQTNAVSGFRALTTLDLITILEGSQKADENHPYYEAELAIAKKAKHKSGKFKGQLKYPTEKLAIKAAIKVLGTKGEHAAANANTMLKIAILKAKYMKNKNIDVDSGLTKIFQGHGQIHGTKGTFNLLDKFGTTNIADWLRLMLDPRRKDMFSPDGKTTEEVVIVKTAPTTRFSKSEVIENIKLKNLNQAPIQGATVMDFDETAGVSENYILATKDGKTVKISSADWPNVGDGMIKEGWSMDFTDFNKVTDGKPGPLFEKLKNQIAKYGVDNVYILTARAKESAPAIQAWLASQGINLPIENITGLGNSTGEAKADWIENNLILNGFNDIYFVDDAHTNVDAVAKMFATYPEGLLVDGGKSVLVQPANFSISDEFNQILEENEGVRKETVYSEAKGKIEGGSKKNFWNLIFPPSAYDFELFLYRIIGKGEKGKKDLAWFKKHLLDPYDKAYKNMQDDAQRVTDAFKALVKKLPEVKKNLKKTIPGTKFTYEQALRVSIWTDMELEVPGLSNTDLKKLLKAVDNDPSLVEYKEGLKNVLTDGYPPPTDYWTIEGVAYDMDRSINAISRAKHLEAWKKNKDEIFSKENRAKLEAIYGERYVESLDNMLYRMEFGGNKKKVSRIESNWNTWVNNSVGAIMFFNFRSATLQTISAANFVDLENNTPYKAAKAFANVNQYRKDFVKILFSNYLKQRRGGGKRTLNEAELTEYLKGKKNPLKAGIAWMLEKGFTPTSAADSLAIAVGGATFYRNQVNYYLEQNYSLKDAEAQAWIDFSAKSEKGQQSSRPDLLSEQQAGGLGRLILAFKNTQQQYFRIMTKATLDIKNKRGSLKGNLSKIAYYGVLQNALFASLQTALFAAFGDDEEWDKKTDRMAQTMIDSVLAGLGLAGAVIITVKNGILTYVEQKERGFNADHTRTILQFANLSPTIGSKLRKLYSAIRTEQLNQDAIDKMGLDINSPAVNSIASLISAATNVPVDRAVTITQNLILASTDEANFNQSLALILGWSSWDIGMEPISRKVQREAKEERKKLMEKLKLMEKEKENLAKQQALKDKGFCAGAKKDGKDCSLPVVKGTSFCTVHAKVKQRKDGKKPQCTHVKKNGKRCGVMTANKSGLCYYHD